MKRIVYLVSTVILTTTICYAQAENKRSITGGFKAGLNISRLGGGDAEDYCSNQKVGFCAGGFVALTLTDYFSLQAEALFTMKGAKFDYSNSVSYYDSLHLYFGGSSYQIDGSGTWNFNYLEIPILFRFSVPTNSKSHLEPFGILGSSLGIRLDSRMKFEYQIWPSEGDSQSGVLSDEIGDIVSSPDLALIFGAGTDLFLHVGTLSVEARYTFGLRKVFRFENVPVGEESPAVYNRAVSVMVGYAF